MSRKPIKVHFSDQEICDDLFSGGFTVDDYFIDESNIDHPLVGFKDEKGKLFYFIIDHPDLARRMDEVLRKLGVKIITDLRTYS